MTASTTASVDRTPKPCPHPRADHQHGTHLAYDKDGCRCLPCVGAASAAGHLERYRTATGTHTYVDAGRAREHVTGLLDVLTVGQIEQRSGVHRTAIRVLVGDFPGRPATRRVTRTTEAALLAVMPDRVGAEQLGLVDGTGTRRRFRALIARGWPAKTLQQRTAFTANTTRLLVSPAVADDALVRVATRDAVRRLYDELSGAVPPASRASTRAQRIAAARGWVPPIAWDDEAIDDPDAGPVGLDADDQVLDDVDEFAVELVCDGQPMHLTGRELEVAVDRLTERGLDAAAIAARCRSDQDTVRRIRDRVQQRARRADEREQAA